MAKVYIVSAGEYSDWYIKKIFLNKEKAEAYHKICNDYALNDIEEYETSDEEIIMPINYCECKYRVFDYNKYGYHKLSGEFDCTIKHGNTEDDDEEDLNQIYFYDGELQLKRVIHGNYNQEQVNEKYLKVCQDLAAFIRNEIIVNGVNEDDISELLENKNID